MAETPKHADQRRMPHGLAASDDGSDGDNVIGIGGVAHAQEEANQDERQ